MSDTLTKRQEECVPRAVFQLIPIRDLVSNQDYQRNLSEGHIMKILNDFDVCQLNPVKISRRDGVNYVFDGQHTIEVVAAKSGSRDTPVWCMVFDDLQYRDEAYIFAEQQKNKKNLVPFEVFNAHVEAGSRKQLLIKELVNSYGLEIAGDNNERNSICAVSALESVYDKYGYHLLDRTIRLILGTWEGEWGSFSGSMIRAVARLLVTYGSELQEEVFKANVGAYTVRTICRRAKEIRPGSLGLATAMVYAYNDKKKKNILSPEKLYTTGKGKKPAFNVDDPDLYADAEEGETGAAGGEQAGEKASGDTGPEKDE